MTTNQTPEPEAIRDYVRERYGAIAEQAGAGCGCGANTGCCTTTDTARSDATGGCCGAATEAGASYGEQLGYSADELAAAADADLGLGCGNPLAIAGIQPGEVVVDLGSGAGFDCLLAARRLAGTGRVIGVDMTPAMVTKARANAARSGLTNVEFRLGEIEALPVADATADLVISNCVVNLSPEKARVLREAFRALKPGGRLALADIVATRPLPESLRARLSAIGACVGGAAQVSEVQAMLAGAGFTRIEITPRTSSRAMISQWTEDETAGDFVVSALITAFKPEA